MQAVKSYVRQLSGAELQKKVSSNDNRLSFRLDGKDVTLVRGTHFYLSRKDRAAAQQ